MDHKSVRVVKRNVGLHYTWETWSLCDINIVPRNNLSRVYQEKERKRKKERVALFLEDTPLL